MSEEVEEKIKAVLKNEIKKEIMSNLDSGLIFTYIQNLEKEIEELKKDKKALLDNYNKVLGTFISKDKIREILNQYGEKEIDYAVDFYKEIEQLLGE